MRLSTTAFLLAAAFANTVAAAPTVDPASDRLCVGYEETIEGVWMDDKGAEVLRFRFASNESGDGCYAWLNPVPSWGIENAGSTLADKFQRDGASRAWGRSGQDGVFVNLATGDARFVRNGRTTKGKVIEVKQ